MITAFLQGGMANQCIIASAALATAQRLDTTLGFNTSCYHNDPMRRYSLSLWEGFQDVVISSYPPQEPIVKETGLPYSQELVDSLHDGCTMVGFFQSEKYFKDIKSLLKTKFVPKQALTDRAKQTLRQIEIAGPRSTFLTIRRSDYLKSDFHGVLGSEYYLKALEEVSKKVDPIVFVFSDDPDWCEKNLRLPCPTFISGNWDQTTPSHLGREDSELWCMFHCYNAILANSSYSWLGAWLGADDLGGTIVAPEKWFYKAPEDSRDIVPSRWTKITGTMFKASA